MKIVFLNGGFANQIFQYIFYRYAQIKAPGEEWYLDDSFLFIIFTMGMSLRRFSDYIPVF